MLSLKRKIEEEIDDAKLEAKAKKQLTAEKKEKKDIGKVIPTHITTDYEKSLRKIATRGGNIIAVHSSPKYLVVQLFNALRAAQKTAEELEADGIQKNVSNGMTLNIFCVSLSFASSCRLKTYLFESAQE